MESKVNTTSERILTLVKEKGYISFSELEVSLDDSYNVIFLAIDKLVRENKINLERNRTDYLLSTHNFGTIVSDISIDKVLTH
ncbi:MAG: hypothetical protein IT392_11980 [Nitrospirae bacterium]|nr:hypothetical protein [Nitrospirota bacterium]